MVKLADVLNEYHASTLKQIAEHINLTPQEPMRKSKLVSELTEAIQANTKDSAYINNLDVAERAVLAQLLVWNRPVSFGVIELHLIVVGIVDTSKRVIHSDLPDTEHVIYSLLRKGLIVDQTPLAPNIRRKLERCTTVTIATEVQKNLSKYKFPVLETLSKNTASIAEPPYKLASDMPNQFRRMFLIWSDLRRTPARRLKAGSMSKRDLRRIAEQMGLDRDEGIPQVVWLDAILRAMNLVNVDETQITAVDTDAAMLYWTSSSLRKIPDLLNAYTNLEHDLPLLVDNLRLYSYYDIALRPSSEIRSQVLKILEQLTGGNWLPYHMIVKAALSDEHGGLTLDESTLRSLSYRSSYSTDLRQTRLNQLLQSLDESALLLVLHELSDLGIVELGYNEPPIVGQPPDAIQLSAWMQAHYQKTPAPEKTQQGQIIIQPDFQILCMGPVSLGELSSVENCAIREKLDESVITYRITKESVYDALQRGENAASIIAHLEDVSAQPIPQNIKRSLRDWENQHHRIILHKSITILQADSTDLISSLQDDTVVGPLINNIDDQTAWIHNQHLKTLEDRLMALQQLASFTEDEHSDMKNSLLWQADELHTRHPLPSLFVTAALRRFAENLQRGSIWQINQTSLKNAAGQGMSAPDVLNQLSIMTGEPVPDIWIQRIKSWMGYFGTAQSAPVRLLRLKENTKLNELRQADPRFTTWLRPLPEANGVVVVEMQHWDDVCTALDEWGIINDDARWW